MRKGIDRSFLARLLQTTGLSLALMMASAIGVRAETVSVNDVGSPGADSIDDPGFGGAGGVAFADAGPPGTVDGDLTVSASATGGIGGSVDNFFGNGPSFGGPGGLAEAEATGSSTGNLAILTVANGGDGGFSNPQLAFGGLGGSAIAQATGSSTGRDASVTASATGGGGVSEMATTRALAGMEVVLMRPVSRRPMAPEAHRQWRTQSAVPPECSPIASPARVAMRAPTARLPLWVRATRHQPRRPRVAMAAAPLVAATVALRLQLRAVPRWAVEGPQPTPLGAAAQAAQT